MNFEDVQKWCHDRGVDARGIIRGGDFWIRPDGSGPAGSTPQPGKIFHWELHIRGMRYPCSPSDMERLVKGKMSFEDFVKAMTPREGRSAE